MKNILFGIMITLATGLAHARVIVETPAETKVAPVVASTQKWSLEAGRPIHEQMIAWASKAGWGFQWHPKKSWVVPSAADYEGTFEDAISAVVEGLYAQGKPVRLVVWGNKFAEVIDVDAK